MSDAKLLKAHRTTSPLALKGVNRHQSRLNSKLHVVCDDQEPAESFYRLKDQISNVRRADVLQTALADKTKELSEAETMSAIKLHSLS